MAYFMLVTGKQGICRGASSYRNNAGWHEMTDIARPLSGSGYQYRGRDELSRRVEVKMIEESRGRQIGVVLERDGILPWVAVEAASSDGKPQFWWTFFDVRSAGFAAGTDYNSPTEARCPISLNLAALAGTRAHGQAPSPRRFRRSASIPDESSIATPTRLFWLCRFRGP